MSLTKVSYTKDWNNPSDFPTIETSEVQVRLDMQNLYDQVKEDVNTVIDELESTTVGGSGASQIGTSAITGVIGANVQDVAESLKSQIDANAGTASADLTAHTSRTNNPHSVTASQTPISVSGMSASNTQAAVAELKGLDDLKLPIATAESTYETIASANALIKNVTLNADTGVFTFTKQDNTTIAIDTALETIPTTMRFFENPVGSGTYYLGIYDKDDNLISSVNVSALFNPITVEDTTTIDLTQTTSPTGIKTIKADVKNNSISTAQLDSTFVSRVSTLETQQASDVNAKTDTGRIAITLSNGTNGKTISADIVDHSIGETQIDTQYMTNITAAKTAAETAQSNAESARDTANIYKTAAETAKTDAITAKNGSDASALVSEGYAKGTQNGVDVGSGSPYYHDNSKYFKEQAALSATTANTSAGTATDKATLSQSWAVGGTGTREGENTNNSKYWCEQASAIAGGVFVTGVNGVTPGGVSGPVVIDTDDISDTNCANKFVTQSQKDGFHTHANKSTLDNLTQTVIDDSHTHANKSTLDNLTQTVIDDSHTHANKSVLDGITSGKVSEWNGNTTHIGSLGNAIGMRGWNQLVQNGNFAGTSGWSYPVTGSLSISGGIGTFTASAQYNAITSNFTLVKGHKYFYRLEYKTGEKWRAKLGDGSKNMGSIYLDPVDVFTEASTVAQVPSDWGYGLDGWLVQNYNSGTSSIQMKNVICIDLTALFGSGNEPSTVEEFRAMFPAEYYPYCPIQPIFDTVSAGFHNGIYRGKDITSYYTDGTLWKRINGTDGYSLFEDLYVGDYFKMSRAISAYERTGQYQVTGSDYVTIAGFDTHMYNGDGSSVGYINYHHICCIPDRGIDGLQHFGRSRMNASNDTTGGYASSEMHTTTIGAVTSSGATGSQATINQQLYAEFTTHLKTTRELLSNSINATGYNRLGTNSGCSNGWAWYDCQAVLMSEVEVYGSVVWSSSGHDTGNANNQLPIFRFSKAAINNRSAYYWLKDIASATTFANVGSLGTAYNYSAGSATLYVRPRFLLS